MNYVGLFEGISGFGLAFKRTGANVLAVCEIDKTCQSVLRRHHLDAELLNREAESNSRLLDHAQIIGVELAAVGKAVTVWTKDNAIFKSVFAALTLQNDVMRVAACLAPSATHTNIGIHSPHRHIPRPFVGIFSALTDDIRTPFIPRHFRATGVKRFYRGTNLSLALFLILMPDNIFPGTSARVGRLSFIAASTSANNKIHKSSLPRKEYSTFSRNAGILQVEYE